VNYHGDLIHITVITLHWFQEIIKGTIVSQTKIIHREYPNLRFRLNKDSKIPQKCVAQPAAAEARPLGPQLLDSNLIFDKIKMHFGIHVIPHFGPFVFFLLVI